MSEPTSERPTSLPYQEITGAQYATTAAGNFEIEEYKIGILTLRGPCPRCGAMIEIPVVDRVVRGVSQVAAASPSEASDGEPVICTCEEPHDGRPEGQVGCGAYWNFIL
jgi:hypothetical protein